MSGRRHTQDEKAASRDYFDGEADRYESHRRWRRVLREQARALVALELRPDDELLDVGCGTGAAVRGAAAQVTRAVGLDLSPGMIEEARRLAAHLENVTFELGDAEQLPFPAVYSVPSSARPRSTTTRSPRRRCARWRGCSPPAAASRSATPTPSS